MNLCFMISLPNSNFAPAILRYGYFVGCNLVYQFPTTQFADAKYYGKPAWPLGRLYYV